MGKITCAEPADIIVIVTGKLQIDTTEGASLKSSRAVIESSVSSWIGFGLEGRKLFREIVIDVIVSPEYIVAESKGRIENKINIKIIVNGKEIADFVKQKEGRIIKMLSDNVHVEKIEFDYDAVCESMLREC